MSWTDLLFNKNPFEEEDEVKEQKVVDPVEIKKNTDVPSTAPKPAPTIASQPVPKIPEAAPPIAYSGGLNQKIYETIHKSIFEKETPFSKFIDLYEKMNKIIPNEQQCVAAVIVSMGITPDEIINSINQDHKAGFTEIQKDFEIEIQGFINDNINKKEQEIKKISDNIESNKNQILDLQKKNEELANKGKEIYDLISDNKYKLEQKKSDFAFALQYEKQQIENRVNVITHYNNNLKEGK